MITTAHCGKTALATRASQRMNGQNARIIQRAGAAVVMNQLGLPITKNNVQVGLVEPLYLRKGVLTLEHPVGVSGRLVGALCGITVGAISCLFVVSVLAAARRRKWMRSRSEFETHSQ